MNFRVDKSESYNAAQQIQANDCNAIIFVNIGSDVARIDGRPIPVYAAGMQAYPSIEYFGLEAERMNGSFNLTFDSTASPGILVIRKHYV